MRIGKKKAKFTIRIIDNYKKKTKSFIADFDDINTIKEVLELLKKLLREYYDNKKLKEGLIGEKNET